jgi:hypothetical protein
LSAERVDLLRTRAISLVRLRLICDLMFATGCQSPSGQVVPVSSVEQESDAHA